MSKLRRSIRNLGRPPGGGIGFAAARSTERPRQLLLVASIDRDDPAAAVSEGADALLAPPDRLAGAVGAADGRPVGALLDAATVDAVRAAVDAGADFFVFDDARTPAAALLPARDDNHREEPGRVLRLEADTPDERLRSIAALTLDALLVPNAAPDAEMTVRAQLALRRAADLSGAPLMAAGDAAPSPVTLEIWRDAGVRLVLVPATGGLVRATAEAIAEVPPPRRVRDGRETPLVPALGSQQHEDDEEPF